MFVVLERSIISYEIVLLNRGTRIDILSTDLTLVCPEIGFIQCITHNQCPQSVMPIQTMQHTELYSHRTATGICELVYISCTFSVMAIDI